MRVAHHHPLFSTRWLHELPREELQKIDPAFRELAERCLEIPAHLQGVEEHIVTSLSPLGALNRGNMLIIQYFADFYVGAKEVLINAPLEARSRRAPQTPTGARSSPFSQSLGNYHCRS